MVCISRRLIISLLVAGIVAGGAALAARPVAAGVSFTVGPALLDLSATPGATGTHELTVSNTGDVPLAANVAVESIPEVPEDHTAASWLSVSPSEIVLDLDAQQRIAVEIEVPEDSASGGRYARITITTSADAADPGDNAAAIAGQVGVGVLLTVEGDGELIRAAEVTKFAPVLEADGRIGFRALVRNTGNVHLLPRGTIEVREPGNAAFGTLELKETTPHLPGATVLLASHGSLPLPPDTPYDARLAVTYAHGDEQQHTEAAASFRVDAALALAAATLCENLDRGPTMRVGLQNEGTVGLESLVSFTVQSTSGQPVGGATVADPAIAWPQETTELVTDLPQRLESGAYVLAVTATYGTGQTVDIEIPFDIGGTEGAPIPLCASGAASSS